MRTLQLSVFVLQPEAELLCLFLNFKDFFEALFPLQVHLLEQGRRGFSDDVFHLRVVSRDRSGHELLCDLLPLRIDVDGGWAARLEGCHHLLVHQLLFFLALLGVAQLQFQQLNLLFEQGLLLAGLGLFRL